MTLPDEATSSLDARIVALRRRIFDLEARNTELEFRLRKRGHEDDMREFERRAAQRDLELRESYVRHLEGELGRLHLHAVAVSEDRDRVAIRMRELEQEVANGSAGGASPVSATEQQVARLVSRLRRIRPVWVILRTGFKVTRRVLRPVLRVLRRMRARGAGE
jgi:chromosome segregation ATPase